jgi:hypothetical protein
MNLPFRDVLALVFGGIAYLAVTYTIDRSLAGIGRVLFRYVAVAGAIVGFFLALDRFVPDWSHAVDVFKMVIAVGAAGCVFYEVHRASLRRPIAERWKKFVGMALGVASIAAYFNGLHFDYPYYHRWDQFHYYIGAKYFKELGYDGLYKCTVIAQDDLGNVEWNDQQSGRKMHADFSKEVRDPKKTIMGLSGGPGGGELVVPVTDILAHPEECKDRFTPARWEKFKADITHFRTVSDRPWWEDMQRDHGYNPPPVWTIAGRAFAELHPASTAYLRFLSGLDFAYLGAMFVALYWAFGWRVCAVGMIFWGCQASAPALWTNGAFLRQDWLFYLVFSACLMRKRWYKLSGAAMVYAGLLRIFPGLVVIGWLGVVAFQLVRHHRMTRPQVQTLIGGVLAAAVLIPLSLGVAGKDAYQQFYAHTIQTHDSTPLTNHMGLRVLVAHKAFDTQLGLPPIKFATGSHSGRMKYVEDGKLTDPFEIWKKMRNERYAKYKWVAYGIIALSFAFFMLVLRRVKSLWIAQCLAQVFVILLSQLTSYYYSFLILSAPLTKAKRQLEVPLFGFAALSQLVFGAFGYNDDKYTALTLISLLFCYGVLAVFAPPGFMRLLTGRAPPAEPQTEG